MTILASGAVVAGATESMMTDPPRLSAPNFRELAVLKLDAPDGVPDDVASAPDAAAPPFGEKDSWRWFLQGGFGYDWDEESNTLLGGFGVSYFMTHNVSIELELNGFHIDRDDDSITVGNFNLLLRWHFLARDTWSLYADGGAGLSYASDEIPAKGTRFNFTPQLGVGASFDIGRHVRLLTGARWHHMSNARQKEDNPGRDALLVYAQVSFPF